MSRTSSNDFFPVILCGGSGTRLWPMSRRLLPKQFLPLVSERSMLQDTAARVRGIDGSLAPILVSNDEHRFLVAEQFRALGIKPALQILEPVGRNTAPAVAVAAFAAREQKPEALLLVLPSDHRIADQRAFHVAVNKALPLAAAGDLVTFGISPSEPATGFGYIEQGAPIDGCSGAFRVTRFVEKPDAEKARAFLADGGYLWNSGMFVFSAARYLEELERFRPDVLAAASAAWRKGTRDLEFLRLDGEAFGECPSVSVDYAVMERTGSAAVVAADMGWSDAGSWSALWEVGEKDAAGNLARGDVHLQDALGSYVRAESRFVSSCGLRIFTGRGEIRARRRYPTHTAPAGTVTRRT
ncbi:MAG: mannose-1-phosphate guanylyltransferase/mannose-6-phosphate isomerase [Betaproteobacteria bacterium]|nr:mannose-1-phosphate guanylyltransferase/mannose-6-phosphate isomerase [Betaproteobacteria bacterium]